MTLAVVAFGTMILAGLAILAGVWLLVRAGRLLWAALILVVALTLHVAAFTSGLLVPALTSVLLLLICVSIGTLVGWWIQEQRVLMIALPIAALSDLISTLAPTGFTRQGIEDAARGGTLLTYMAVSVPFEGEILNVIGFGDLVVLAVVILALRNVGVGWAQAFAVPFAGYLAALTAALAVGHLPGLPFLAITTLAFLFFRSRRPLAETN